MPGSRTEKLRTQNENHLKEIGPAQASEQSANLLCDGRHRKIATQLLNIVGSYPAMSLDIHFDGAWEDKTKAHLESTLRACIGNPPEGQDWMVLVTCYGNFSMVLVKATQQSRSKLFLLPASELAKAIPDWLEIYPLR